MEGLLRKYKISKISDNVKLTEKESNICIVLDKCLIGLTQFNKFYYMNIDGECVFEHTKNNNLCVYTHHCWTFLDDLGLHYCDIQVVIKSWVEDLYKLKVNTTWLHSTHHLYEVEDLYKLKVNTTDFYLPTKLNNQ